MSLREARFGDHWRHVFEREFPTRFTEMSFEQLHCLADGGIRFSGGISAIVGGNGVGKSTLAAAIAELLSSDPNSLDSGYRSRLSGSTVRGVVISGGTELQLGVHDDPEGKRVSFGDKFSGEHRALDPSALASRCLHQIHTDQNFGDLLESLTPLQLGQEELAIASYLVGKKYTGIETYEISEYGDLDRFPYFRVTSAGVTYGSEGMGRGELSLMLTYWTFKDMPKGSILILEEPETHVSPRSQDSLMNVLAKFCDEMGVWTIITTHSPTVVRRIPREHIKHFVRGEGLAACAANTGKLDVALLLGGGVAYAGIIFVEDEAAKAFLRAAFEKIDPEMSRQLEIVVAGSESAITSILKSVPLSSRWLTIFGAYDGDMRAKIDGSGFKCPFGFLPGDVGPEELLQAFASQSPATLRLLADELGKTEEQMQVAFDFAAGADHHDFFNRIADVLGMDASIVLRGFVRVWLNEQINSASAETFIQSVRKAATGV